MNARLLILSLIIFLGLGAMDVAEAKDAETRSIDQQNQALVQQAQTYAQTYRQLRDQKKALLDQLRMLNNRGTAKDWADLYKDYNRYSVSGKSSHYTRYQTHLSALTPAEGNASAFQDQVVAILNALVANRQQQEALVQSIATLNQSRSDLNTIKKAHNVKRGKN